MRYLASLHRVKRVRMLEDSATPRPAAEAGAGGVAISPAAGGAAAGGGDAPVRMFVGARVTRGRTWEWSEQDGGAGSFGTVTSGPDGHWWDVSWDKSGSNSYRWSPPEFEDIVVVGGAPPAPPAPKADRRMYVDAKVRRGRTWTYGDQDGGAGKLGVVLSGPDEDGWWRVRWSDGSENTYEWNGADKEDLELAE